MNNIVIIGTGGIAKGVLWLIESINILTPQWKILGLIGDRRDYQKNNIPKYEYLGDDEWLLSKKEKIFAVCAIGFPEIKVKVINKYYKQNNIIFPTLISPNALIAESSNISNGCVIYPGTVIAPNTKIGKFVSVNYNCTIGHDVCIADYCCINPSAVISGYSNIGERCLIGANSSIMQNIQVASGVKVGMGAVVIKDIMTQGCSVVGNPAVLLEKKGV